MRVQPSLFLALVGLALFPLVLVTGWEAACQVLGELIELRIGFGRPLSQRRL